MVSIDVGLIARPQGIPTMLRLPLQGMPISAARPEQMRIAELVSHASRGKKLLHFLLSSQNLQEALGKVNIIAKNKTPLKDI